MIVRRWRASQWTFVQVALPVDLSTFGLSGAGQTHAKWDRAHERPEHVYGSATLSDSGRARFD